MIKQPVLLFGLLLMVAGCATSKVNFQDSTFSAESLKAGKLAMGGVIPPDGRTNLDETAITTVVDMRVKTLRPWIETVPLFEVKESTSAETYAQMLKTVYQGGRTIINGPSVFQSITNKARYLLVVEIEKYKSRGTERRAYRPEEPTQTTPYDYEVVKSRSVEASVGFRIHDMWLDRTVWHAVGQDSIKAQKEQGGYQSLYQTPAGMDAPTLEELIEKIATRAFVGLPK